MGPIGAESLFCEDDGGGVDAPAERFHDWPEYVSDQVHDQFGVLHVRRWHLVQRPLDDLVAPAVVGQVEQILVGPVLGLWSSCHPTIPSVSGAAHLTMVSYGWKLCRPCYGAGINPQATARQSALGHGNIRSMIYSWLWHGKLSIQMNLK